jgi:hypothetical protein
VISNQGGALRATLIALVVGLGPLAVAAAFGWRSTGGVLRLWALLLIPIALSVVIAGDLDPDAGLLGGRSRPHRCAA